MLTGGKRPLQAVVVDMDTPQPNQDFINLALFNPDGTAVDLSGSGGGGSGVVETIVAGDNVTVDSTDPANPIVSASGSAELPITLPKIQVYDGSDYIDPTSQINIFVGSGSPVGINVGDVWINGSGS